MFQIESQERFVLVHIVEKNFHINQDTVINFVVLNVKKHININNFTYLF